MKKIIILLVLLLCTIGAWAQSAVYSNFTIQKAAPTLFLNGTSATINFYNGDLLLQQSSNLLTLSGGNLSLGANSLLMTGSLGATASRLTKGWFTDLEVTNTITGTASLVTGFTRNSGTLTLSGGHGLTFTTTGPTNITLPTSGTMLINPMTTAGDIIIGAGSGVPQRLPIGTEGTSLSVTSGVLAWETSIKGDDVSAIVNDSILARIAAATVGLAAADTNTYGGAATRTFVEAQLGSGSGLSAQRLTFIVGVTTGAPEAADSTVVHSEIEGKHIDLYRDGAKQYQQFTATNIYEGFRISSSTITVNPAWQANEQVLVDIIEPILWSYLSLEGQESALLDSLNGYWKFDEASGTGVVDATGTQNGTTNATAAAVGKLSLARDFDSATDVVNIAYNAATVPSGADFSVAMWFKMDSLPSVMVQNNYLFQQNVGSSPWSAHYVYVDQDDRIMAVSRNTDGTAFSARSAGDVAIDTWYHVVFVNRGNGQTLQVYLNGSDVSASAGTFTGTLIVAASTTCFGNSYSGATSYLDGIIDEPGIWNRALTSGEVTTLYNSGNGRTHPFN